MACQFPDGSAGPNKNCEGDSMVEVFEGKTRAEWVFSSRILCLWA